MSPRRIFAFVLMMFAMLFVSAACITPAIPESTLLLEQQRDNIVAQQPTHEGVQQLLKAGYRPLYFTHVDGKDYQLVFVRCEQRDHPTCKKETLPTTEYPHVSVQVNGTPGDTVILGNEYTLIFPAMRDDNGQYCKLQQPSPLNAKTVSQFKEIGTRFEVKESLLADEVTVTGQTNDGRAWTCTRMARF